MKLKVKGLRPKNYASGIHYYWEPSPAERKANWTGLSLGKDLVNAIKAAEERNKEIEDWREGGAKSKAVARYVKPRTVAAGIERYKEIVLDKQSKNTQRTASTAIKRIVDWCGQEPIKAITKPRARKWRDALIRACDEAGYSHHPAFHAMAQARTIWKWFVGEGLAIDNPFASPGVSKPPPRQVYWEDRHVDAITETARELGEPMVALAVEIGLYCGQREADNLAMSINDWREIPATKFRADPAVYQSLVADARELGGPNIGQVMGIYVRQGKTKRWVGIPVEGQARLRIEAAIADAKRNGRSTIIGRDRDGQPWRKDNFIERFGKIRRAAADRARSAGDDELASELEELWYGDLRRSCVVYLGELGLDDAAIGAITGHTLTSIKQILEVYMPRTEGMAARAITARRDARAADNVTSISQGRKQK